MSNAKMLLIIFGILIAGLIGLILGGLDRDPKAIVPDKWGDKSESLALKDDLSIIEEEDTDAHSSASSAVRKVESKKLNDYATDWIYRRLKNDGYMVSSVLVHGARERSGTFHVNGMAEVKYSSGGRRMRINWLIYVNISNDAQYMVVDAELTDPFLVTR